MVKVMVTYANFRKVFAETQVRSSEHLRLDKQFYYIHKDMQLSLQYIQRNTPSQLGFDLCSAQTPLSGLQYRQNAFDDSRLSESMTSVWSHGRMQGHPHTDRF